MQPLCNLLAVAVFDPEPRHSSVPAKSRSAAARNGGQGRSPGRRALGCLPGKAKHCGIRFVVGAPFQVSLE
jgi:hypothetical protein